MSFPVINFPSVPPNTIVPENKDLYISYFNSVYENVASAVNAKDNNFFIAPITSTATNIPNIPNFGSFIICVSGTSSDLPTITAALCKSSAGIAGETPAVLVFQEGKLNWSGFNLTITSSPTNFQIAHDRTGVTGNFNIKIIGTQ